jgi:hypothetical protein
MHRLNEIRIWEDQRYHATGADTTYGGDNTLNTVYIERTIEPLKQKGVPVNELLVSHPSPLLYKI